MCIDFRELYVCFRSLQESVHSCETQNQLNYVMQEVMANIATAEVVPLMQFIDSQSNSVRVGLTPITEIGLLL